MSIDEVNRSVPLGPEELFSHSAILRPEIDEFRNSFERNERFREFEGLIRSNHRLYEALEANVSPKSEKLSGLVVQMNKLSGRIEEITKEHFTKEELSNLDLSNMSELARMAETKQKELEQQRKFEERVGTLLPSLEEE